MFFAILFVLGSVFAFFAVPAVIAQSSDAELIARVGAYVERYYTRAQTLVVTETTVVEPVTRRLEVDGPPRRLVSEMRIEWDGTLGSEPREVRQLESARGNRFGPAGQPDCLDQRSVTFAPLAFLLPANRDRFRFTVTRFETINGVRTRRIDYTMRRAEPPRVRWNGKCGWIDSYGRTRGSVWVEPASGEVLRVEERLNGRVKLPGPPGDAYAPEFVAERADMTIDYKRFAFVDPDETLLLPSRVEEVNFIQKSLSPRVRVTRTFTDYRRFLTGGRIFQTCRVAGMAQAPKSRDRRAHGNDVPWRRLACAGRCAGGAECLL